LLGLFVSTIANKEDSMIKVRRASLVIVNNTALILEPFRVTCANTNRNWSNPVKCSLELSCVFMLNIPIVINAYNIFARVIITVIISALVRVVFICFKAVIPNVIENPVRKATTTALILIRI
jgi:hypothetical protein